MAKAAGWTHRRKSKRREPYLKLYKDEPEGATYIDMDQKYRWVADDEVVLL